MPLPLKRKSTEDKLREALIAVLRRLGHIGKVAPHDDRLIELARQYAEYRWIEPVKSEDDQEEYWHNLKVYGPRPELDDDIPF